MYNKIIQGRRWSQTYEFFIVLYTIYILNHYEITLNYSFLIITNKWYCKTFHFTISIFLNKFVCVYKERFFIIIKICTYKSYLFFFHCYYHLINCFHIKNPSLCYLWLKIFFSFDRTSCFLISGSAPELLSALR